MGDVQDVVDDLEGKSHVIAEPGQGPELGGGGVGTHAAEADGGTEERGGLAFVDVAELGSGNALPLALEVGNLTGDQLEGSGRPGEFEDDVVVTVAGADATEGGDFESLGEESVAGKDGNAFAKDLVAGETSAAVVVVVHRREVVVDEGVGVDTLDGTGEGHGQGGRAAASLGGGERQDGTEPLAPGEKGVAHGPMDGSRANGGTREQTVEGAVDFRAALGQVLPQREAGDHVGGRRSRRCWHAAFVRDVWAAGKKGILPFAPRRFLLYSH